MERHAFLSSAFATLAMKGSSTATASHDDRQLAALERRAGGRLGIYAIDTGSGREITHRANERFAMCSTFKLLATGAVLARVDAGSDDLARRVAIADADILSYAPVTKQHLRIGSMTLGELCAAAIEWSDNTAANLLLHALAGPAGVTRFARRIGDPMTRLDRNEPSLNTAVPGDPRDTTSPAAMARDMRTLVLGNALTPASRTRLRTWLLNCKTGDDRLRAGMPAGWRCGNKTGTGDYHTMNDVAIMWPPHRAPIIIAAYYTGSNAAQAVRNGALREAGRLLTTRLSARPMRIG